MIGGCLKSDTCRQKRKDKREVYHVKVGKSCDLVFIAEFYRQPMEFIQQWCYVVSFSFLQNELSHTVLNPLQLTYLFCRQTSSSILFNLFLEKIMQERLHDHHISISIGGRSTCNLQFADDIDLMGSSNGELQDLTNRLVDRATAYEMEVCTEKSDIMTNGTNNISANISMNGQKLGEVTSFKYLGATLCKDGTCSAEILIRIASAMAAMARLNWIWWYNNTSFTRKFKLY